MITVLLYNKTIERLRANDVELETEPHSELVSRVVGLKTVADVDQIHEAASRLMMSDDNADVCIRFELAIDLARLRIALVE